MLTVENIAQIIYNNDNKNPYHLSSILFSDLRAQVTEDAAELYDFLRNNPNMFICNNYYMEDQWSCIVQLTPEAQELCSGETFISYWETKGW